MESPLERVIPIPAFNSGPYTGSGNTTYLVDGREPALIDAGTGDPRHLDAVAEALGGRPLARVLVTHGHTDHIAGAGAVCVRWPSAVFLKMPWPEVDRRVPVAWHPIADGALVAVGDTVVRAIHTPGHAPDHLAFFHEPSRTLFSGDLLVEGTTVVIPASRGGSLAAYLASLERVRALCPRRLLPAHGPPVDEPEALIKRYLAHRREREVQILDRLARSAGLAVDGLVASLYPGLAADLVPAARETVLAHLLKLEEEGRVVRLGDRWYLAPRVS